VGFRLHDFLYQFFWQYICVFSFQLVLSSHQFFFIMFHPLFCFSAEGCPWRIHEILWETLFHSPDVVSCRTGHTREILECTRNQVSKSILIMPFHLKPPTHFCVTVAHLCFSSLPLLNEISIHTQLMFPLFNDVFFSF